MTDKNAYGLKPCPICGWRDVTKFLNCFWVVVECRNPDCGCTISNSTAQILYKGDPPQQLVGVPTYEPTSLDMRQGDGSVVPAASLGYKAISIPLALQAYGITERWNRRTP